MQRILVIIILLALFCSCQKRDVSQYPVKSVDTVKHINPGGGSNGDISEENKKYQVSFTIDGFTKDKTPIGVMDTRLQTNSVKPNITVLPPDFIFYNKLMYIVYDSTGTQISRLEENLSPDNIDKQLRIKNGSKFVINSAPFGTFTDSLKTGTYTMVITAGTQTGGFNIISEMFALVRPYPENSFSEAEFYPSDYYSADDAFFYKTQLKVSKTDIKQTITPHRIVGQITLQITDAIPTDADFFLFSLDNESMYYNIDNEKTGFETSKPLTKHKIANEDKGKAGFSKSFMILNTNTPVTLTAKCYSTTNQLLAQYSVPFKIQVGETKLVSTKLFSKN